MVCKLQGVQGKQVGVKSITAKKGILFDPMQHLLSVQRTIPAGTYNVVLFAREKDVTDPKAPQDLYDITIAVNHETPKVKIETVP